MALSSLLLCQCFGGPRNASATRQWDTQVPPCPWGEHSFYDSEGWDDSRDLGGCISPRGKQDRARGARLSLALEAHLCCPISVLHHAGRGHGKHLINIQYPRLNLMPP